MLYVDMVVPAEEALLGVVLLDLEALSVAHQLLEEGHAAALAGIRPEVSTP